MNEERDRSPEGRFKYLAVKRVKKALSAIESVSALSDTKNYKYTPDQALQIIEALDDAIEQIRSDFNRNQRRESKEFTLK